MGQLLEKVPWNQDSGVHNEEMWFYSNQPNEVANFWRRWVYFQDGKAIDIISDYWID